jgi:hypothetical protein
VQILRNLDLLVLAVALIVCVAAGFSVLGWAAAAFAWIAARVVQALLERRAAASGDRRMAMRARAATLIGRLYLVGLTVLGAGLIERDAGVVAGVVSVATFTVYFASLFIVAPFEEAKR